MTNNIERLKELTSQLKTAQGELDRFFELSYDLMAISDLRGIFRRVNRSWERVLGHPVSALTTRPFLSFIHEDDRAKTEEAMVKLKEGKPIRGFINRYRHIDGTCRIMQWNADFDPETGYIFAIARDITQLLREVQLDF